MALKCSLIDNIKKEYEYKLDPLNLIDTAVVIYGMLSSHFVCTFEEYKFDEKLKEIKTIINKKRNKIKKNILEGFENILNEIADGSKNIIEKVKLDYAEKFQILGRITNDYLKNMDKPGVKDLYLKIGKDMIDKEVKILIQYHKILISYNDHIINIKKNLTN